MESLILSHLLYNEEYARKVIPYLKAEYFHKTSDKIIFNIVQDFITKYNSLPSKEICYIDLTNQENLSEQDFKECQTTIGALEVSEKTELDWLTTKTEEFCKEKALYNVIRKSITYLDDKTGKLGDKGVLTKLFADALAVPFDPAIGHDFFDDFVSRWELYHLTENRIAFDLELFNKITRGGVARKTLSILMGPPGIGKSIFLCHFAAANLSAGYNVLYITLEMAQERIAERIDANLLDVPIEDLEKLSKEEYTAKIRKIKQKTDGKLIIKEYPTSGAGSNHFRHLLEELKIKKNFRPDIIYVDYLNICASARMKYGSNVNTYMYMKSVAEELRGIAVEYEVPVFTATQVNRQGFRNSDPDMENTSDSIGLPQTTDLMFTLITNEDLEKMNQIMVKQLKNRYSDPNYFKRFVVGVDKKKMRLYNTEQSAQDDIIDEPVMDGTSFGQKMGWEEMDKTLFEDVK